MFYLTSRNATALRPVAFTEAVRNHWGVESWHWVKDVVFDEDRPTATTGNLTANLASLRAAAIAILTRLGGKGITACRDHIGSHPHTKPLEILDIAHIKQKFQVCLSRESRGSSLFVPVRWDCSEQPWVSPKRSQGARQAFVCEVDIVVAGAYTPNRVMVITVIPA